MKTFIVAALLVAAVAGQSMDIVKLNKDTKSMFKFDRPVYPMVHDYENNMIDNYYNYKPVGDFEYDTTTVYQLDEIVSHPLFREYMSFPIFRQFWEYPMFQRYVASIYFQRFWQVPVFRQYFVQPALFYKYVYPIVTLFKYESASMNTYNNGNRIFNRDAYNAYPYTTYNTQSDYYYAQQHDLFNYMPTVCHYNTVYCQALFQKFYNHFQTMLMTYGEQEQIQMPYQTTYDVYNPYVARMIQGYYNRYPTYQTEQVTPYTFNKDNMYNNVYSNKENMYNNVHFNKENMYNNVHFNKDMNTFEAPKMVDDFVRYETIRPIVHNMMGVQTFDRKYMPERVIKA